VKRFANAKTLLIVSMKKRIRSPNVEDVLTVAQDILVSKCFLLNDLKSLYYKHGDSEGSSASSTGIYGVQARDFMDIFIPKIYFYEKLFYYRECINGKFSM
jgi:hypothetical protein